MQARALQVVNVLVLGAIALAPSRGSAQSASAQAQSLFDEGRKQLKAGKLAEACAAFEASQKLDPAVTTLLNLADCREQSHQLASAWGLFIDANRMAKAAGNARLAGVATSHARKLEPRLSRLTISVPADRHVPGLAVLRGKDPVDPVSWNHALPIDGGSYTITARAPGREPWSTTRTIKVEGDAVTIEIFALAEPRPAGSPPVVAPAPPAPPPVGAHGPSSSQQPSRPSQPSQTSVAAPKPAPPATPDRAPAAPAHTDRTAGPPAVATRDSGPPGASPAIAAQPEPGEPGEHHDAGPSRVLPLALGGAAVALGGTALGFDLWGNSQYDRAKESTVQTDRDSLYHSANTKRYVAVVSGVVALGCAGAAVYLYVRGRGEHGAPAAAVAPVVSPGTAGLAVVGRW